MATQLEDEDVPEKEQEITAVSLRHPLTRAKAQFIKELNVLSSRQI